MAKTKQRPSMDEAIDKIIDVTIAEIEGIQHFISKMSAPRVETIGSRNYKFKPIDTQTINQETSNMAKMVLAKIGVLVDEYIEAEQEFQTLRGEELTPDTQLLNGDFVLTKDEIKKLADKYIGNYSMFQAVLSYARKQGCENIVIPLQTPQQLKIIIDSFWSKCQPRVLELTTVSTDPKLAKTVDELKVIMENYKTMALQQIR